LFVKGPTDTIFTKYDKANNGLAGEIVYDIYKDSSGLYIATNEGLSVTNNLANSFTNYQTSDYIYFVTVRNGTVYLGTKNGMVMLDVNDLNSSVRKTTADGLGGNLVKDIKFDSNGNMFIATDGGISMINLDT
jgi:ligand-binding sensor domain-containing protein